jgi:polyhydroxyalkanoate synthesis regulator phasin
MKIRKSFATLALAAAVFPLAACGAATAEDAATAASASTSTSVTSSSGSATGGSTGSAAPTGGMPAGGPGGVDVSSVSTEAELIELVQDSYGDGSLELHRGHQPVQDVLDEVLSISHDELHVRMEEQGQNLAAVAEDIGVDPQTLIDALVESRASAVDAVLATGEITADEAQRYRQALEEAFTFRVTWNGEDATPSFTGLS